MELTALPETPYLDLGPLRGRGGAGLGKRRVRGGRGEVEGGKGRAPKLLLNQGPSEPCYATVSIHSENTNVTIPSGPPPVTGSITDPVASYISLVVHLQKYGCSYVILCWYMFGSQKFILMLRYRARL